MARDQSSAGRIHATIAAARDYSNYFDHIHIFDFHQPGDMTNNFICQMLPMAATVCKGLATKNESNVPQQRISYSLDAEMLVEAAYRKGYFQKDTNKKRTVEIVSKNLKRSNYTTAEYSSCLSQRDQARLFNASFSFWTEVTQHPAYTKHYGYSSVTNTPLESQLQTLFRKSVSKNKFCEIDTEKVLATDDWTWLYKTK